LVESLQLVLCEFAHGFNTQQGPVGQPHGATTSSSSFGPSVVQVQMPTQIRENPAVVHEQIRREQVEEIQPIMNIEKLKTEVHQVTQPLLDKEIKPVAYQQVTLAREVLPEVIHRGGPAPLRDISTVAYQNTQNMTVQKPAIYTEVDETTIIEEIQPVIYKETVVPSIIQETQPIYQKIVEGPTYIQETLAPRDISGTHHVPQQIYQQVPHHKILGQTVTTTTTSGAPTTQMRM